MRRSLIALALFSVATLAQAQSVYAWVDAQGHKHYGDATARPPRSIQKDVHVRMSAEARAAATGQAAEGKDGQAKPKSTDALTAGWENGANPGEKLAPTRSAACEVAKRNVSLLSDQGQPAYTRGADGQPVALDGQARSDKLAQAYKDQTSYCSQ